MLLRTRCTWNRRWKLLPALVACLLVATAAQADPIITYFDGNLGFGFDNSDDMLPIDVSIPSGSDFGFVAGNVFFESEPLWLAYTEEINDTVDRIDRTITWEIINRQGVLDVVNIFLTALGDTDFDYSATNIRLDVDGMDVFAYEGRTYAGYALTLPDFVPDGGGDRVAIRTFRYTVDVGEPDSGPPDLGVTYTTVPEPVTGLLLGLGLFAGLAAGRPLA